MDNQTFFELTDKLEVQRNQIFISMFHSDKKALIRLQKRIEKEGIRVWSMFNSDGTNRNGVGDQYEKTIKKAIDECCLCIFLISKKALASDGVKEEIGYVEEAIKSKKGSIKAIPVIIDDLSWEDIPNDMFKPVEISDKVIAGKFGVNSTEEEMELVCKEIFEQYYNQISENVAKKYTDEIESQVFNNLMRECIKKKSVSAKSVSDDIKDSDEVSVEKLLEVHVLSDELREYDCNTYSCMVIAKNLLGPEKVVGKKKHFVPEKNGVKYYYYFPEEARGECDYTFNKIRNYITKNVDSRREVVRMIKSEFCARNKVGAYFYDFNGMTCGKFKVQYGIHNEEDIKNFDELFMSEEAQCYFCYSNDDDVFQVPDEFWAWLDGDTDKFSYNEMTNGAYEFIKFLSDFLSVLDKANDNNSVTRAQLKTRINYLERLKELELWQEGQIELKDSEKKRLVNYLLGFSIDKGETAKKFPQLVSWMELELDETKSFAVDEETVEKAFRNLIAIPIRHDKRIKMCYSFVYFIGKTETSGAWYSIGQESPHQYQQSVVLTYNIEEKTPEYNHFLEALNKLIEIDQDVKETLENKHSELLRIVKNEKRK